MCFFYYLLHRVTLLMTWNKKIFFAKREKNSVLQVVYNLEVSADFASWGISGLGGISTFWVQKIRPEKLLKFTKILNYIKFSCFMNCFKYFPIYILGQNISKNETRKLLNYVKSLCANLF